uniref:DBB domain-containing protein n=1 Tax=Cavia porcellus TaxID=10141 RepID=H0VP23_CAVPO
VSVSADQRVNSPEKTSERNETEASSGPCGSAAALATVLPAEVPCENPGEIFIFLKDEVVGETVEAEFMSHDRCIRARLALWDKNVWCMKAPGKNFGRAELPYSKEKVTEGKKQNDIEELDGIFTSIFKQEIPYYDFHSLQSEICPQNEYTNTNELPTLLHCAAKFGLKNLALHLLQCPGANWALKVKNTSGADPAHIAKKYGHEELEKILGDFSVKISGSNEQLNDYEEDRVSLSEPKPTAEPPACCAPPLPPPRSACAALPPEKPRSPSQGTSGEGHRERSHSWATQAARDEPKGEEKKVDGKEWQVEEDPYTFEEIEDSEYDMILSQMSVKRKPGSWSFIVNRPPAPTPRPTNVLAKEETTPYIAQVFQQKTARKQSDSDRFQSLPKKPEKARTESPAVSIPRRCLEAGQEELILLQEKVKKGKLSVDEALEKFKHWQMGKSSLELIQQEKLRQLRYTIIGDRPEEANVYEKLTIVHHPSGKFEKEFGVCCRKDH